MEVRLGQREEREAHSPAIDSSNVVERGGSCYQVPAAVFPLLLPCLDQPSKGASLSCGAQDATLFKHSQRWDTGGIPVAKPPTTVVWPVLSPARSHARPKG